MLRMSPANCRKQHLVVDMKQGDAEQRAETRSADFFSPQPSFLVALNSVPIIAVSEDPAQRLSHLVISHGSYCFRNFAKFRCSRAASSCTSRNK